jgi:diacylglycerol kinase (ATP)
MVKLYTRQAFMLSFANSSQYGNNAHISPMRFGAGWLAGCLHGKTFPAI